MNLVKTPAGRPENLPGQTLHFKNQSLHFKNLHLKNLHLKNRLASLLIYLSAALGLLLVLNLFGCERSDTSTAQKLDEKIDEKTGQNTVPGTISLTIFAASSLTEAFEAAGEAFKAAHPGVGVELQFAGSQTLRTQIENGARADVFASASPEHLETLAEQKLAKKPRIFAENDLIIVTPADNPAKITSLEDLRGARHLVVGNDSVPIGAYTAKFLERAEHSLGADFSNEVQDAIASRESNVRLVLSKVELGEADAGIVYRSDAKARGARVHTVEIPDRLNIAAGYFIARITHEDESEAEPSPKAVEQAKMADEWISFIQSPVGQTILSEHGFLPVRATQP